MSLQIGVIGMGLRMTELIGRMLQMGECSLCAVTDTDSETVKDRMRKELNWSETQIAAVRFYQDAEAMLQHEDALDGVCVGTRCSLHAEFGALVIRYGIPLFLEKPVATSDEGVQMLTEALRARPEMAEKTVVSFPLRLTNQVRTAKEIVDSGRLGTIEHVQAINDVPYGRVYYHGWYRDEKETGGLWLQKATHDFDYINAVLGIRPIEICAMNSKQIFKGDKPTGSRCEECDEALTCPESYWNVKAAGEYHHGPWCCFAEDTGNEDSGSAIIRYETGMHAVYSQNFFARKGAGLRGARFLGYNGTVEFSFQTDEVRVYMHNTCRTESYRFDAKDGHSGGDEALCRNFIDVMAHRDRSCSALQDGLLSVKMCFAAKKSCENKQFVEIEA